MDLKYIKSLNTYIEERQKTDHRSSARDIVQSIGYDYAKKRKWLEPYADAWGVNFKRPADAWEKNWAQIIINSQYYKLP